MMVRDEARQEVDAHDAPPVRDRLGDAVLDDPAPRRVVREREDRPRSRIPRSGENHGLTPTRSMIANRRSRDEQRAPEVVDRNRTGRLCRKPRTVRERQTPIGTSQSTPRTTHHKCARMPKTAATERRNVKHQKQEETQARGSRATR